MRIVHEITTPMQIGGGGKPYGNGPGKQGFVSGQVEMVICESPAANHPELPEGMFGGDEVIHIEGDTKYIIPMLKQFLGVLESLEEHWREKLGESRSTNCPDGCENIDQFNGTHEITCPRHVNYGKFSNEVSNG